MSMAQHMSEQSAFYMTHVIISIERQAECCSSNIIKNMNCMFLISGVQSKNACYSAVLCQMFYTRGFLSCLVLCVNSNAR